MKKVLLLAAIAMLPASVVVADSYTVDPAHTYVSFSVNHLGFEMYFEAVGKEHFNIWQNYARQKNTRIFGFFDRETRP